MVISPPYKRSIGEMNISPSVQGPYSRWSLVLDPATGLRGTLPWVTRDVLIYQGLHVVSAKYVDAPPLSLWVNKDAPLQQGSCVVSTKFVERVTPAHGESWATLLG